MDQFKLRVRFLDALKADRAMPLIIAAGLSFAVYRGVSIEDALAYGLPAILVIWLGVALIETKISILTISKTGLEFKSRLLKPIVKKWAEPINVREKKSGKHLCHEIIDPVTGESAKVPKVIFTYPEVIQFIRDNVPSEHEVRKLVESRP